MAHKEKAISSTETIFKDLRESDMNKPDYWENRRKNQEEAEQLLLNEWEQDKSKDYTHAGEKCNATLLSSLKEITELYRTPHYTCCSISEPS